MSLAPEESIALLEQSDEPYGSQRQHSEANVLTRDIRQAMLQWISAVLAIFLLADLLLYLSLYREIANLVPVRSEDLEFRNPYTGLDDLYQTGLVNASHYNPILSLPRIAVQVSGVERKRVFPEDDHRWLSRLGTMSPPDRHVLVTDSIHTIVQFRAMDFGMERCALAVRFPSLEDDQSPLLGNGSLEVCELDVSRMLDTRTLSWTNRPECRRHIGTFSVVPGEEIRFHEFPCSWGTLPTYEISCAVANAECRLDIWGGGSGQWGLVLYQFQTLGQ